MHLNSMIIASSNCVLIRNHVSSVTSISIIFFQQQEISFELKQNITYNIKVTPADTLVIIISVDESAVKIIPI